MMHRIDIAPEILERARLSRGGGDMTFTQIDPARTAHLIIDMQNGFVEPGGTVEITEAREIVPAINRISKNVRQAGGINIFVQFVVDDRSTRSWSTFLGNIANPDFADALASTFAAGSHGHALYPAIHLEDGDLRVDKARFGSFTPGTSKLQSLLESRGIDTLIVTGCATNVCCETTAREAMQLDYKVLFVADATAALTDVEHNAALNSLAAIFADIVDTDAVIQLLAQPVIAS